MTLSVIIPVYNVADYIDKCIDSVLCQDIPEMEVILVDDGSTDDCPAICDRWAERDSRITVLHKANGGLSDARNVGLDIANGEYVTFVDSDDWLLPGTYQPLMEWLKGHGNIDILEFSLRHIGEKRMALTLDNRTFRSARQYWEHTRAWNHAYSCNKIYRRWLFESTRFPVGRIFEDVHILPLLLAQEPRVATTSHGAYCYEWNDCGTSVTASAAAWGLKQHIEALQIGIKTMHTTPLSRHGWNLYYSILCRQIDLYRLSGEVTLPWPGVRLLCWLHKKIKGKRHEDTANR